MSDIEKALISIMNTKLDLVESAIATKELDAAKVYLVLKQGDPFTEYYCCDDKICFSIRTSFKQGKPCIDVDLVFPKNYLEFIYDVSFELPKRVSPWININSEDDLPEFGELVWLLPKGGSKGDIVKGKLCRKIPVVNSMCDIEWKNEHACCWPLDHYLYMPIELPGV